ncbi:MAG: dTMP kinase [Actinobacteria bacterium]|nr:dTMP kinase [Actinomycetota bacterium]
MKDITAKEFAGRFIVIDGPDGSGKTTQLSLLAEYLGSLGLSVVTVRDPGGTDIGEAIRQILLSPAHQAMTARTELLLYTAARLQLWLERIAPTLKAGSCVLSDRWIYSTCAYQGSAGELGTETVCRLTDAMGLNWADHAVILDIDPRIGLTRLSEKPDRMESKPLSFHQAVHRGYLALADLRPEVAVVDASGTVEQTQQAIRRVLGV